MPTIPGEQHTLERKDRGRFWDRTVDRGRRIKQALGIPGQAPRSTSPTPSVKSNPPRSPTLAATARPPPVPSTSSPAVASITPVVSVTTPTNATSPISGASLPISTTPPSPGASIKLQPLTPSEIRERTYDALKLRLQPDELDRLDWEKYKGTTASKAEGDINDLKTKLEGNLQHSKSMNKILQYINKYCAIVDVAIQHHPDITALVWAGARTAIQVCPELVFANSTNSSLARYESL